MVAACWSQAATAAQTLPKHRSSKLKVLRLDVSSDAEVEQVKAEVLQNLLEKGEQSARCKK